MDTVITEKRNGFEIVRAFGVQYKDPEASKKLVIDALERGLTIEDIAPDADDYIVWFNTGPNEKPISPAVKAGLSEAIRKLPPYHVLTIGGEVVHRLDTMTPAEIAAEREAAELNALDEARKMRSGLEIQGEKLALEISQEFYCQEMERIEQAYTR
jgi:hypothetical protein